MNWTAIVYLSTSHFGKLLSLLWKFADTLGNWLSSFWRDCVIYCCLSKQTLQGLLEYTASLRAKRVVLLREIVIIFQYIIGGVYQHHTFGKPADTLGKQYCSWRDCYYFSNIIGVVYLSTSHFEIHYSGCYHHSDTLGKPADTLGKQFVLLLERLLLFFKHYRGCLSLNITL